MPFILFPGTRARAREYQHNASRNKITSPHTPNNDILHGGVLSFSWTGTIKRRKGRRRSFFIHRSRPDNNAANQPSQAPQAINHDPGWLWKALGNAVAGWLAGWLTGPGTGV
ncbi:hypothetical protein VTJ04DRAFT_2184 [Mycothermus thermophilus]|uniref:uncharacterized protein n=1 Tax=Humicola insolens TaxID=85995 RepID=UPI003743BFC3